MNFKQLFDDDRAVSPVIGVILMVAITVILAAVIGTFVLGLGDQLQTTPPTAQIGFDYDQSATSVTITHVSGETLPANTISVKATQTSVTEVTGGPFTAGDTIKTFTYSPGETIRVIWTSDDGQSSTLAKSTAPN